MSATIRSFFRSSGWNVDWVGKRESERCLADHLSGYPFSSCLMIHAGKDEGEGVATNEVFRISRYRTRTQEPPTEKKLPSTNYSLARPITPQRPWSCYRRARRRGANDHIHSRLVSYHHSPLFPSCTTRLSHRLRPLPPSAICTVTRSIIHCISLHLTADQVQCVKRCVQPLPAHLRPFFYPRETASQPV